MANDHICYDPVELDVVGRHYILSILNVKAQTLFFEPLLKSEFALILVEMGLKSLFRLIDHPFR